MCTLLKQCLSNSFKYSSSSSDQKLFSSIDKSEGISDEDIPVKSITKSSSSSDSSDLLDDLVLDIVDFGVEASNKSHRPLDFLLMIKLIKFT